MKRRKSQPDFFEDKPMPVKRRYVTYRDKNWKARSGIYVTENPTEYFVRTFKGKLIIVERQNVIRIDEKSE